LEQELLDCACGSKRRNPTPFRRMVFPTSRSCLNGLPAVSMGVVRSSTFRTLLSWLYVLARGQCSCTDAASGCWRRHGHGRCVCTKSFHRFHVWDADVEKAFRAHDAVRRPRTKKLVEDGRKAGFADQFLMPGVGDDADAIKS
jgi:hypothetical protein